MKRLMQWMMVAILICSATIFTACTQNDNPVDGMTGASSIAMIVKNGEIDYFRQIETSFREVCQEKDLEALYYSTSAETAYEEQLDAVEKLRQLDNSKLKGIIFTPCYGPNGESAEAEVAALAQELDIPVIILDSPVRAGSPLASCPYIGTDNTAAGEAMAAKVTADKVALFATTNSPGVERAEAIKKLKPNAVIYQVADKANEEIQAVLDEYDCFVFCNGNILVDAIPMLTEARKEVYTFDVYYEFLHEMFSYRSVPAGIMVQNTFEMARKAVEAVVTNAKQGEMVPTFYFTRYDERAPVMQPFLKFYYKEAYATIDDFVYILNYNEKTATLEKPDNGYYEGDIVVPDYVVQNGIKFAVTAIGYAAFRNATITSLQLPKQTLKMIDLNAFSNTKGLKTLVIPEGVTTIAKEAIMFCDDLTHISIPASVEEIGDYAINACYSLESITVDEGNKHFGAFDGVLMDKAQTRLITYPANKAGNTYTIPNTVKNIDEKAFVYLRHMTSLIVPASVSNLSFNMFVAAYSLEEINVDPANTAYSSDDGVLYSANKDSLCIYPAGKPNKSFTPNKTVKIIGPDAFAYVYQLETLDIPEGVTNIYYGAFGDCYSLKEVSLPESVIELGSIAFSVCESLEKIVLPPHITVVEKGLFMGCKALKSVTIPAEVTTIEDLAFVQCTSLTELTCLATIPPTIGYEVFLLVPTYIATLYVPDESVDLYKAADTWKTFNVKPISEKQ